MTAVCPLSTLQLDVSEANPVAFLVVISSRSNHKLEVCDKLKRKNGEEQFMFVHLNKLCDNCVPPFHFAAGCKQSKSCSIPGCDLKQKYLTSPHEPVLLNERSQQGNRNGNNIGVSN